MNFRVVGKLGGISKRNYYIYVLALDFFLIICIIILVDISEYFGRKYSG